MLVKGKVKKMINSHVNKEKSKQISKMKLKEEQQGKQSLL